MAFKAGLVPSLDVLLVFVAESFVCCNSAQSGISSFFNKLISTAVSGVAKSCDLHHILADLAPGSPLSSGNLTLAIEGTADLLPRYCLFYQGSHRNFLGSQTTWKPRETRRPNKGPFCMTTLSTSHFFCFS